MSKKEGGKGQEENQLAPHLQEILDALKQGDRINLLEKNLSPEELKALCIAAASDMETTTYTMVCPFCGALVLPRSYGSYTENITEDRKNDRAASCDGCGKTFYIKMEDEKDPWIGRTYGEKSNLSGPFDGFSH